MIGVCAVARCTTQAWSFLQICEPHARQAAALVKAFDAEQNPPLHTPTPRPPRKAHERAGWIYYLDVGGRLKIGFEKHEGSRLSAYPPETVVLGRKRGTMADELAEHQRCTPWRIAGREWYELNDSTRRVVEEANLYEKQRRAAARAAEPAPPRPDPPPPDMRPRRPRRSPDPPASPQWRAEQAALVLPTRRDRRDA